MFEQDKRAAAATDLLLANPSREGLNAIRGWVVVSSLGHHKVRFVRQVDAGFDAPFEVAFSNNETPRLTLSERSELTASELAQFRARQLAIQGIERPCSNRYNTIALTGPDSGQWMVWAIAATDRPGIVMVGGHYRFTISADGKSVIQRDALSRSCLALDSRSVPADARTEAMYATHIVSDTPVETHVYLSLLHRLPIAIRTYSGTWMVKDGRMERYSPPSGAGTPPARR